MPVRGREERTAPPRAQPAAGPPLAAASSPPAASARSAPARPAAAPPPPPALPPASPPPPAPAPARSQLPRPPRRPASASGPARPPPPPAPSSPVARREGGWVGDGLHGQRCEGSRWREEHGGEVERWRGGDEVRGGRPRHQPETRLRRTQRAAGEAAWTWPAVQMDLAEWPAVQMELAGGPKWRRPAPA